MSTTENQIEQSEAFRAGEQKAQLWFSNYSQRGQIERLQAAWEQFTPRERRLFLTDAREITEVLSPDAYDPRLAAANLINNLGVLYEHQGDPEFWRGFVSALLSVKPTRDVSLRQAGASRLDSTRNREEKRQEALRRDARKPGYVPPPEMPLPKPVSNDPPCPETPEELFLQGVSVSQAARMLKWDEQRTREEFARIKAGHEDQQRKTEIARLSAESAKVAASQPAPEPTTEPASESSAKPAASDEKLTEEQQLQRFESMSVRRLRNVCQARGIKIAIADDRDALIAKLAQPAAAVL